MKKKLCLIMGLIGIVAVQSWSMRSGNAFGTHQSVLASIANSTTGPIVEFGCGDNSTDLLHEICKKTNRMLISVDDNLSWLDKFRKKYLGDGYVKDNSGWHKFFYIPGKSHEFDTSHWIKFLDNCELFQTLMFDLCFIDQSPWMARYETIKRFRYKARYIILHDCDFFPENGIFGKVIKHTIGQTQEPGVFDFSDVFTFFKVFFPSHPWPVRTGPPTLLGSNFESRLMNVN